MEGGGDPLALLPSLLPAYASVLADLVSAGADWVQIDEPCLATDLTDAARQAYRTAYGALASGGNLVTPTIVKGAIGSSTQLNLNKDNLQVIYEGMRKTVTYNGGTARGLEKEYVQIAAKSGTAEIGTSNAYVNSWAAGFWPYDKPKYAYAVVLEKAKAGTLRGASPGLIPFFQWLVKEHPEYAHPGEAPVHHSTSTPETTPIPAEVPTAIDTVTSATSAIH